MLQRIEVNLLPAEYRVHRQGIRFHREIVYPLLIVVAVGVALFLRHMWLVNEIVTLEKKIAVVESAIAKNRHVLEEIKQLRRAKDQTREKIMALRRINVNREKWVRLQETFCANLPERTWLTSIEEKRVDPPMLEVKGKTFSFPEVGSYMSKLTESDFISGVDLASIEVDKGGSKAYEFVIMCDVNPNARIADIPNGQVGTVVDESADQAER